MKIILSFSVLLFSFCFPSLFASENSVLLIEENTLTGTQVVIPEEINWTQRFILTELKDLRVDLESHQRQVNIAINEKELALVDRALSYSANTVNFFFVILTIAVMAMGLFGWRTMKDIKENLSKNFEKEVQKKVSLQQKKLEEFMEKFQEEQLKHSEDILQNQENIQKKQETAYYWSQFNREEDPVEKLDLLERIGNLGIEEDEQLILVERASIYIVLGLWDKALEAAEKGLELTSENTSLLYAKAEALVMLEENDDALKVITNILVIKPGMKEDILEDPVFEDLRNEIGEIIYEPNDK